MGLLGKGSYKSGTAEWAGTGQPAIPLQNTQRVLAAMTFCERMAVSIKSEVLGACATGSGNEWGGDCNVGGTVHGDDGGGSDGCVAKSRSKKSHGWQEQGGRIIFNQHTNQHKHQQQQQPPQQQPKSQQQKQQKEQQIEFVFNTKTLGKTTLPVMGTLLIHNEHIASEG